MQNNRFLEGLRRVYARYDRLMEKQGFYIVLAVCVLVILLSALYTFQLRDQWEEPPTAADTGEEALAAGGSQGAQTLSDAKALVESRGASQLAGERLYRPRLLRDGAAVLFQNRRLAGSSRHRPARGIRRGGQGLRRGRRGCRVGG